MARSRVIGFLARAVIAGGAIGCGGSLVPADAGAGTGGGAGAGSMSDPPPPQPVAVAWGGVTVYIQNVTFPASLMDLKMSDQASPPALDGSLQFFPTGTWDPTSGAGVAMQDGCGSSLSQLQLVSCSKQTHLDRAPAAPGCLVAVFTPEGTTGSFIHPNGATCDISSSTGDIHLPQDWFVTRHPELSPTAWGKVMFDCQGSDGTWLKLEAEFTIPLNAWTLLC